MNFNITNGTGYIAIGLCDAGSYIKINKPVTLVWPDAGGSVAEYLCLMPMAPGEHEKVHDLIMDSLNTDFTGREQDLYDVLKPLLSLLPNGEYNLTYRAGLPQPEPVNDQNQPVSYAWFTEYPTPVKLNQIDQLKRDYKAECKQFDREESLYDLVEFTSTWAYNGGGAFRYVATRPFDEIDADQVRHFERQIAEGARPWVLVMNAVLPEHEWSADFVLDGHHKLEAYNNMRVNPPSVTITQHIRHNDEKIFDAEALAQQLYPWQMRHILAHWNDHEKDRFVIQKLQNPESPLHKHVRNGTVQEFYDNKQLRHQAFYINDKPHGQELNWYNNGQLKSEQYYNHGKRIGTWKNYYPLGNIWQIQTFNDESAYHGQVISYYENGQKRQASEYETGRQKDGLSKQSWHYNGNPEYEATYLAGRQVEVKRWDNYNSLTEHSVYNAETQLYEKANLPDPADTQPAGQVYVSTGLTDFSDDGIIRGNGENFKYYVFVFVVILLLAYLFWWMGQPL